VGGPLTDRAREADPVGGPDRGAGGIGRWARIGLWGLLVASWVVMVAYMWDALTMVPDAERLEQTRMAVIPTPRTFFAAVAFSALELGVVLALLWPWRSGYYPVRLAGASLGLLTWFVITIPMGMSRMDWVHRRWLFFLILATAAALLAELGLRLAQRLLATRS
jgi:hypothetical protein